MTSGVLDDTSIFRKVSAAVVVVLIASGFTLRAGSWHVTKERVFETSAVSIDGRVDWTVPEGEPPQRLDRVMSRPQDIEAARAFLDDHDDALDVCRDLHHSELGRRVGLALVDQRVGIEVQQVLHDVDGFTKEERDALTQGIVASLVTAKDPTSAWALVEAKVVLQNARLGAQVEDRLGRRLRAMGATQPQ